MTTEHSIPVTDDERVAAVHHEAASNDWLVFCHGFRSDKSGSYERRCRRAVEEGYNAVRFDFRGCGESDGAFVDQTLGTRLADVRRVVDYFDPESYALFGSSFGGKVAFHAAVRDDRVEALVARAPVTYNRAFDELRARVAADGEYAYDTGEKLDARFFDDLDRYPFAAVEAELHCPVAIFHGGQDESVEPTHSFRAADALRTDVTVEKFEAEGHRFSSAAEHRLLRRLFDWLATVRRERGPMR